MAFMKTESFYASNNILASEIGLVQKTREGNQEIATEEDGRLVIKAGTVFPANDATAEGVVFEDVDITDDEKRPISVIVAGRVIEDRLPVDLGEGVKEALAANGLFFEKEVR